MKDAGLSDSATPARRFDATDEQLSAELRKWTGATPALQPVGELLDRHWEAAFAYARLCTDGPRSAGMLTTAAFTRLFGESLRQNGPTSAWRPHLLVTVRRIAAEWDTDRRRDLLHPELRSRAGEGERVAARLLPRADRRLLAGAFQRLPQSARCLLWHGEVESEPLAVPAGLLGLDDEGARVELGRARDRLREECLHLHRELAPDEECRRYRRLLDVTCRRGGVDLDPDLRAHLEGCGHCHQTADQLDRFNEGLGVALAEAVLGWGARDYVASRVAGADDTEAMDAALPEDVLGEAFPGPPGTEAFPGRGAGEAFPGPRDGEAFAGRGAGEVFPGAVGAGRVPAEGAAGEAFPGPLGTEAFPGRGACEALPGPRGGEAFAGRGAGEVFPGAVGVGRVPAEGAAGEAFPGPRGGEAFAGRGAGEVFPGAVGAGKVVPEDTAGAAFRAPADGGQPPGGAADPAGVPGPAAVPAPPAGAVFGEAFPATAPDATTPNTVVPGPRSASRRSAHKAARRAARRRNTAVAALTVSGLVVLPLVLWSISGSGDGTPAADGGRPSEAPGSGAKPSGDPSWAGTGEAAQGALRGRLRNAASGLCVGVVGDKAVEGAETELTTCSTANAQQWSYETDGLLRNGADPDLCLDSRLGYSVRLAPCTGASRPDPDNIRYDFTLQGSLVPRWDQDLALAPAATNAAGALVLKTRADDDTQHWAIDTSKPDLQLEVVNWDAGISASTPSPTPTPTVRPSKTPAPTPTPSATPSTPRPTTTPDPGSTSCSYWYYCWDSHYGRPGHDYGDGYGSGQDGRRR